MSLLDQDSKEHAGEEKHDEAMPREGPESDAKLTVSISFGELKTDFSGEPEAVLRSVNEFISRQIPELQLAKKLLVRFGPRDLVEKFGEYVKLTPEGPRVWSNDYKYSDKELVALQLVAQKIGYETSYSSYSGSPRLSSLTLSELQQLTGLNPKSLSSRLSELSKTGYVLKETVEGESRFSITTQGIDWLANVLERKGKQTKRSQ